LLLAGLAARADDKPKETEPTPKARFDALVKEYQSAQQAFFGALGKAKTPEDSQRLMKEEAPKLEKVLVRFIELAEKNPKDPVAVDALVRVAQDNFASRGGGTSRKKALGMLARDHVTSPKVGPLCQTLGFGFDDENEKLLRAILDKNPSKGVQAEACLALGQNLRQRASLVRRVAEDASLAKQLEAFVGKETAAALKKADPDNLEAEGAKMSTLFADKYVGEMKPDRLRNLCQSLGFSGDKGSESLARALMKHESRDVQGVACLAAAQILKKRSEETHDKDAKAAAALLAESEKLFGRAQKEYADVKAGFRGTVGDTAKKELYELRHLAIGKPAPAVESEDQDGKKFKLSDYKGKVVMLDFWNQF